MGSAPTSNDSSTTSAPTHRPDPLLRHPLDLWPFLSELPTETVAKSDKNGATLPVSGSTTYPDVSP